MNQKENLIKSVDLIKNSWAIYQKNVFKFIEALLYGLMGLIPLIVVISLIAVYRYYGLYESTSFAVNLAVTILFLLAFVASFLIAIFYGLRSEITSILLLKNNFTSVKENFKESKPYVVKFLGVSLLVFVLIIAWCFALLIPALIFAVYYGFAQYVLITENKRPFSAVERSYDLVRGYFWPVLGRLLLIFVLALAINFLLSAPLDWLEQKNTAAFAYNLFYNLLWMFISPYFLIYCYGLYKNLAETNK